MQAAGSEGLLTGGSTPAPVPRLQCTACEAAGGAQPMDTAVALHATQLHESRRS